MEGALNSGALVARRIAQRDGVKSRSVAISRSARIVVALAAVVVWAVFIAQFAPSPAERAAADAEAGRSRSERRIERIADDLTPSEVLPATKDGIAALVLMDVSGSMADPVQKGGPPKIEIAKRSALALIKQFATYASAHPEEPVLVGLYEFSNSSGDDTREIIGLSPADPRQAERPWPGCGRAAARRSARPWSWASASSTARA